MRALSAADRLAALARAVDRLEREWGGWRVAWGEVNRFQRNDAAIVQTFDDARPSIPVPFASARWGSLASFGAHAYPGTRRWYGTSGNSFVAVVEFGPRVRAWAVTAGGESGHPGSPHFNDQAERYAVGRSTAGLFLPRRSRAAISNAAITPAPDSPAAAIDFARRLGEAPLRSRYLGESVTDTKSAPAREVEGVRAEPGEVAAASALREPFAVFDGFLPGSGRGGDARPFRRPFQPARAPPADDPPDLELLVRPRPLHLFADHARKS